mgnify:CR=1 FL=1
MKVKITLLEEVLGSSPSNEDLLATYIASKAPTSDLTTEEVDNIKAQIGRHYQYLSDHDSLLTAKKVYDRYNGFGDEVHSLMEIFDSQIEDYRRQIGRTKAESTYQGLVNDRKCLLYYLKDKLGVEDVPLESLDMDFIKGFYNWMLSVRGLS